MRASPAEIRSLDILRTLASKKGFVLEPSTSWGAWRLIGPDKKPARDPSGAVSFSKAEARSFLMTLPDV
jgi:hypothetical protein